LEQPSPIVIADQQFYQIATDLESIAMLNSGWLRTALGFLVAPISPGLLIVIFAAPFTFGKFGESVWHIKFGEGVWLIMLSGMLGYPIATILGVPLYIFFRWRGWNGLVIYISAGALLGLTIYLIYIPLEAYSSNGLSGLFERLSSTATVYIPLGMVCGAVATLAFWLIARPDRTSLVIQ